MDTSMLMPVHPKFMDVFETFMNEEQKSKIRANNVRQYIEGIIDLLLKDKINPHLKPTVNDPTWSEQKDVNVQNR